MRRLTTAIGILAVLGAPALAATATAPTLVGVLEERPPAFDGDHTQRLVRAVFTKDATGWHSLATAACQFPSCFPQQTAWTIGFDGKEVGHLTAKTPAKWDLSADIGYQMPAPGAQIPVIGRRAQEFSMSGDVALYRPLVASSAGHVTDPEHWHRGALDAKLTAALRQHFHTRFAKAERCTKPDDDAPKPWAYKDSDIAIGATYVSSRNWTITTLQIPAAAYRCDGPADDSGPFVPFEFAVSPTGAIIDLAANLKLIDAGDYDGDGKSELVFVLGGYDTGGYKLYAADFTQSAQFQFSFQ